MITELKNAESNSTSNSEEKKTDSESKKNFVNSNEKMRNGPTNGTGSLTEKSTGEERWKEVFGLLCVRRKLRTWENYLEE